MQIIDATPDDAEVLSLVAFEAKRYWGYPEHWLAAWRGELTVSREYILAHPTFVAVDRERIIGFGAVEIGIPVATLAHLWVLPGEMRKGVGRALFLHCERTARNAGCNRLEIESDPHAAAFYLRMGAERIGARPADMNGVQRSLPILSKVLRWSQRPGGRYRSRRREISGVFPLAATCLAGIVPGKAALIMRERDYFGALRAACTLMAGLAGAFQTTGLAEDALRTSTFIYKQIDELAICAEVTRPDDDVLRPVVVWIHGGALMKGERLGQWHRRLPQLLLGAGYVIVSIDYRLAPETKLPGIVEDVVDACAWVRSEGERLFRARTDRLAVAGESAGGYLTLVTGYAVKPEPAVLVAVSGYGDLAGDWAMRPSTDPEHLETKMSAEELAQFVPGSPVANKLERSMNVTPFYNVWRQQGRWPQMLTGWDPRTEAERFKPFLPLRHVSPAYPPTLLIHGKLDLDVDYRQSVEMAAELKQHGVEHDLIVLDNAEHGLRGATPEQVDDVYRRALDWIRRHMED